MKIFTNDYIMNRFFNTEDNDGWKAKAENMWHKMTSEISSKVKPSAENVTFTNEDLPLAQRIELAKKEAQEMIETIKQTQNK